MSMPPTDRLYRLLPAIYRIRDFELKGLDQRGPLQKLLAMIEQELEILETDVDDLYDDWFIETCDDWVVPYIGDLVGIQELYAASFPGTVQPVQRPYGIRERRAYVANTIAYRRRKGTASVLEQLTRDVTGWGARVVEFWDLLAISQNLEHIRPTTTIVNIRSSNQLDRLGTAFEQQTAYTTQVRPTRSGQGRYNVPNLGLFVWRLQSYPIQRGTARLVRGLTPQPDGRCYTFSPLGNDHFPLFNRPQTETEITQLAEEINLPGPLTRRPDFEGYQGDDPVLKVFINGQSDPIPPEEVLIAALSPPDKLESWQLPNLSSSQPHDPPQRTKIVAVDPELGRIAFLDRTLPQSVEVGYSYGFSGDIGGGPYDRSDDIPKLPGSASTTFSLTWDIESAESASPNPLADAVQSWNGTVQAWQGLGNSTCIELAKLKINPINVVQLSRESKPLKFRAGIIKGLSVTAIPGTTVAIVMPGRAIDGQGRAIVLRLNNPVDLSQVNQTRLKQQAVLLVVSYRAGRDNQPWQFNLIESKEFVENSDRYPSKIYIPLACLLLNENSQIIRQMDPSTVSSLQFRPQFSPGILDGLRVLTPPGPLEAMVVPGMAVDRQGNRIILPQNVAVDLSDHQGKKVCLVISYPTWQSQQTWQLEVISQSQEESDRYPEDTYIRLAWLEVPNMSITVVPTS